VRVKPDENITVDARTLLAALGHDVDTVADEQLVGSPDPDVLAAAVGGGRALVTFDLGFGDPRSYPPGKHRGVILLRLRDQQPTPGRPRPAASDAPTAPCAAAETWWGRRGSGVPAPAAFGHAQPVDLGGAVGGPVAAIRTMSHGGELAASAGSLGSDRAAARCTAFSATRPPARFFKFLRS
jgi:hypothetical protein